MFFIFFFISIYSLKLNEKFFALICLAHSLYCQRECPLSLAADKLSTVQSREAHGGSCLMVVDYLKGGMGEVKVEAVGSWSLPPGHGSL